MDLSPQQATAVDACAAWLKDPTKQVFYLAGYAGTGKTTLARHLAELQSGDVLFGAYTGKAASVLRKKGCHASTIHSMIYKVAEKDQEEIDNVKKLLASSVGTPAEQTHKDRLLELSRPSFELNPDSDASQAALIVIDEVSMVGEQIGSDLLSFGTKVLVLGDPGQLPPVEGGGFFTARTPDFILTEIHRQAAGNPIIAMATVVRQGGRLQSGAYGDSICFRRGTREYDPTSVSQVICGINRTRSTLNGQFRDLKGYDGLIPLADEKIICLRNNKEQGLMNGTQWRVIDSEDVGVTVKLRLAPWDREYSSDEDRATDEGLSIEAHQFGTDFKQMPWWDRKLANEFDFGYVITCHKAQGSQWDSVLVLNESYCFREDANRWLYTALTRAEKRVLVRL